MPNAKDRPADVPTPPSELEPDAATTATLPSGAGKAGVGSTPPSELEPSAETAATLPSGAGEASALPTLPTVPDDVAQAETEAAVSRPVVGGAGVGPGELVTDEPSGRYEVLGVVGAGGIGEVLRVRDRHLQRDVAVKQLLLAPDRAGVSGDGSAGQPEPTNRTPTELRFVNEARVTGGLEHPAIVPVYELGRRADGSLYYTMRLLQGRTLGEALRGCDLRARLALLPHFVDLCNAIAFAHSRGVIHRDIKPDNVMLGDFGETVVLDWGLAKVRGGRDVQGEALAGDLALLRQSAPTETLAGTALGTPAYMPPEQARGDLDAIDERSDVFALGAVLYQLLTGRVPFRGKTVDEVLEQVVKAALPRADRIERDCPPELAAIVARATRKAPAERYPDARALASDVQAFLTGDLVGAHRYSGWALLSRWVRRNRAALIATALVVAVGCGVWLWRGRVQRQQQARQLAQQRRRDLRQVEKLLQAVARGSAERQWFDMYTFRLIALERPAVERRLVRALSHRAVDVRRLAARALGGMKSRLAVPGLAARLAKERDYAVKLQLINALGLIGDARAERAVRAARWASKQHSRLWRATALAYAMIPLPPAPPDLDANGWTDRGRSLLNKGKQKAAIEAYSRAIALDPKLARAYNNRAIVFKKLGDLDRALADYNKAIALEPSLLQPLHNRALVKRALGDYAGALADLDEVVAQGRFKALALRSRAIVLRYSGRLDDAMKDLKAARELEPDNPRSHSAIARLHAMRGRWEPALAAYDRAIALDGKNSYALCGRAYVHLMRRDRKAARADLDRAIRIDPTSPYALSRRGALLLQSGDRAWAKRDFERLVAAGDGARGSRRDLRRVLRGLLFHAQLGNYEAALADVREGVRTSGRSPGVWYAIYARALAQRAGGGEADERAQRELDRLAADSGKPPRSWADRLLAVARGTLAATALDEQAAPSPRRRCELAIAAAVHATAIGDRATARQQIDVAAKIDRPFDLACALGRALARSK